MNACDSAGDMDLANLTLAEASKLIHRRVVTPTQLTVDTLHQSRLTMQNSMRLLR